MNWLPDEYTWKARIAPVVIAIAPAIALLLGSLIQGTTLAQGLSLVTLAATGLMAQLGRDRGSKLQDTLWAEWGGPPSRQMLHTSAEPEVATIRRRKSVESALNLTLPSADDERSDSKKANERYDDAVVQLREWTSKENSPRVFAENINYGVRRNLLGLKPVALSIAVFVFATCGVAALISGHPGDRILAFAVPVATSIVVILLFAVVIRKPWVRLPANAYAERLLDGVDTYKRAAAESGNA